MLKRIKYISSFARELTRSEIDSLIDRAAENNRENEITGIIVATGQLFFQIIEGPAKNIDRIYEGIVKDRRHTNILLLNSEWGVIDRIFPDWSMKRIDLDPETSYKLAPLREILDTIIESRKRIETLTETLEKAIWEEFSTPQK